MTEFNYRYADEKQACIFVGVRISGESEKNEIIRQLQQGGYDVMDLSNDDVAKSHIRYMIGGRASSSQKERLFSFEFPEQKGALLKFLETLGTHWNISLFHYRAHGADYGNVLAGFQTDEKDLANLNLYLEKLGYVYQDVTQSPAYQYFLG